MNPNELKDLLDSIGPEDATEASGADHRWESLTRGELDDADARRLAALAGAGGTHQVCGDLFEPLDEDFHNRTVDRLARMLSTPVAKVQPALVLAAPVVATPAATPAPIVSPRPAEPWWAGLVRWLRSGWVMTPVLVMALALLFLRSTGGEPLPSYEIEVRGGDVQTRGVEQAPAALRLSPGSRVDLLLRPDRDVRGTVRAAVWRRDGASWVEAGLAVEVSPAGAVRATGTVGEQIPATPGRVELAVVIAGGGEAPTAEWIEADPDEAVVVLTTNIDVQSR